MKNLLPYLLIAIILFSGCSDNKEQALPVIAVSSLIENELGLADIASEIVYIKLNKPPEISKILNIEMSDLFIFINDMNGIYMYNKQGEFIREIGSIGKGPEEYERHYDIAIDATKELVFVHGFKKIYVYDISGKFKSTFPSFKNLSFDKMLLHSQLLYFANGYTLVLAPPEYPWAVMDEQGEILGFKNTEVDSVKEFLGGSSYKKSLLFDINNEMYYWNALDDTIFNIDETFKGEPAFLFGNDKYRLKNEDLMFENYFNKTSWQLMSVLGTNSYLILEYLYLKENNRMITVFDRNSNHHYQLNRTNTNNETFVTNNLDGGMSFTPLTKTGQEEWFVQSIDAYLLKAHVASEAFKKATPKYPEKKQKLEQLANSLDENDNAVLMLVQFKE